MKRLTVLLCIVMLLITASCTKPGDNGKDCEEEENVGISFDGRVQKTDGQLYTGGNVQYDPSLWMAPQWEYDSSLDPTVIGCDGVKAFFMDSPVKYNGKPTKVMGYIGFPEGASESAPVPGIVLVHGGLGTAFPDWVKMWNERGYAAVCIDTEGGQAKPSCTMNNGFHDERNKYDNGALDPDYTAGPTNNGFALESLEKIENSWMYHATSAVILANSLLRSDPRVDVDKVGITGVSWGGVVASILAGYDDRFAFVMPVYGCIGLYRSSAQFNSFPSALARETWDTLEPLKASKAPILWLNGNKDFAFGLDATTKCYYAAENSFMVIKNDMAHGQVQGAEPEELLAFADAVIGRSNEVIKVTNVPSKEFPKLTYRIGSDVTVKQADLYYMSYALNPNSAWVEIPAILPESGYTVDLEYPPAAKYYFVNITYNNGLIASSPLVDLT